MANLYILYMFPNAKWTYESDIKPRGRPNRKVFSVCGQVRLGSWWSSNQTETPRVAILSISSSELIRPTPTNTCRLVAGQIGTWLIVLVTTKNETVGELARALLWFKRPTRRHWTATAPLFSLVGRVMPNASSSRVLSRMSWLLSQCFTILWA